MKKIWFLFLLSFCAFFSFSVAQNLSATVSADNPAALLDAFVDKANDDGRIQNTSMNAITSWDAGKSGNPKMKITNTLMRITSNLHPYIQWISFFWFTIATILIIYNGFLLVTNVTHNEWELKKIQKNFIYIGVGVIILVGFYFLLDIVVAVINLLG